MKENKIQIYLKRSEAEMLNLQLPEGYVLTSTEMMYKPAKTVTESSSKWFGKKSRKGKE